MSHQERRLFLFLVRLWDEELNDGQAGWGGKVQPIISGEAYTFHDWATLIDTLITLLPPLNTLPADAAVPPTQP